MVAQRVDRIVDDGVIAILRGVEPDTVLDVASAIVDGGVTALEVTADTDNVAESIDRLSGRFDGISIGAGTVLDPETARAVQLAGADFIVTPTVNKEVIKVGNRYGTPVASGAYTPTEALHAYETGAELVKIFPANTGGPKHIAAIGGPLSQIPLVPTGGIDPSNVKAHFEAGAVAVGVGSAIVDDDAVAKNDYNVIRENACRIVEAIQDVRT